MSDKKYNNLINSFRIVSSSVSKDQEQAFTNINNDDKESEIENILKDDSNNENKAYENLLKEDIIKLLNEIFNDKNIFKNDEWLYIYKQKIFTDRSNVDIGKELGIAHNTVKWRFEKMNKKVKRKYGKRLKYLLIN